MEDLLKNLSIRYLLGFTFTIAILVVGGLILWQPWDSGGADLNPDSSAARSTEAPTATPSANELSGILATTDLGLGPNRVSFLLLSPTALVTVPQVFVTSMYRQVDGSQSVAKEESTASFYLWPYGEFRWAGGELRLSTAVTGLEESNDRIDITTVTGETIATRYLVACGGLMADRLTRMLDMDVDFRIVPYRGEYYQLPPNLNDVVKHLIYPVPDPTLPFLGVHLTRMIDGTTTVGPSALQGWKREGYGRINFSWRDTWELLSFSGFWRVTLHYLGTGLREFRNALWKPGYLKLVQKYCPSITLQDLGPYPAGVRAMAVKTDGTMIHDFLFAESARSLHVCNAPSPAATSAIPIGNYICDKIDEKIKGLRFELELATLDLQVAVADLELLETTSPMELAALERKNKKVQEDLKRYKKIKRPHQQESAEIALKNAHDSLAYAEEELKQLRRMYESDDLTEETEEIVLTRAETAVERSKFSLKSAKIKKEEALSFKIPRESVTLEETAKRSELDLKTSRKTHPVALLKKRIIPVRIEGPLPPHGTPSSPTANPSAPSAPAAAPTPWHCLGSRPSKAAHHYTPARRL